MSVYSEIPPVAWGYAQAARELGIAPERIQVLDTPVDTAQEARAVRDLLANAAPDAAAARGRGGAVGYRGGVRQPGGLGRSASDSGHLISIGAASI